MTEANNYIILTEQEIICFENKKEIFRTLTINNRGNPSKRGNWAIYYSNAFDKFQASFRGSSFKNLEKGITSFDAIFITNSERFTGNYPIFVGILVAITCYLLFHFLLF